MKYEFGGPEWAAAMHACIAQRLAIGGPSCAESQLSVCEVFLNPPAHLADQDGKLSWSCVVRDGVVDFRREERDDVRVKIEVDYAATLPNARFNTHGDPARAAEMARWGAEMIKAGSLKVTRRSDGSEGIFTEVGGPSIHDFMAALTR